MNAVLFNCIRIEFIFKVKHLKFAFQVNHRKPKNVLIIIIKSPSMKMDPNQFDWINE